MNISHKGIWEYSPLIVYEGGIVPGESSRECSEPRCVGKMDRLVLVKAGRGNSQREGI